MKNIVSNQNLKETENSEITYDFFRIFDRRNVCFLFSEVINVLKRTMIYRRTLEFFLIERIKSNHVEV